MTERGHRFFIGAATTRYHPASGLADRPELSEEVARMADLFTTQLGYERVPFGTDLSRVELITRLGEFLTHPDRTDRDLVVFYYTGHGEIRNGDLALPLPETTADFARTSVWASELVRWLFGDTPVQRFLIILDTCHAAAGGAVVARGGMDYLNSLAGLASDPSIAVLAAARPQEQAESGMFTRVFVDAVRNRATGADQLAYLPLDALVNVIRDQAPPWQHARLFLTGDGTTEFIPNPRYAERLRKLNEWIERDQRQAAIRRAETVSHVLPRAQGLDSRGEDIWLFTGRENAMRSICQWLGDPRDRAPTLIVTGDPGSGKSALLSRIYVLQERRLRDRVPGVDELAEDTLPPVESVARFIHARGLTPDQVLAGLCEATGVEEARDVGDLLVALADRPVPITVIVDAVDEAATAERGGEGSDPTGQGDDLADHPLVTTLLAPLIRAAPRSKLRLLIGTRRHLLGALGGPNERIDLDTAGFADRSSLRNYAVQCLTRLIETSPYARQSPEQTLAVADAIAAAAGDSFLVALIAARSLALRPEAVDSTDHGWRAQLPRVAADAMRADLEQRLGEDADRARDLLLPLAYGEGTGLPWEDLWPRLATAMSGRRYQNSDIDWLLDHAGYYIVHNGQTRRSAYRLYHESLAEHLRERRNHRADQRTIAEVLTAHTPVGADGRPDWELAHPYTRNHLAGHAAHGGLLDELLGDPRFLLAADRAHLLAVLPLASTVAARSAADAYRQAAYNLRNRAPDEHAAYLQLAARCGRASQLADAITQSRLPLPWSARWARWRPQHPHRVLRGHTGKVFAVAVGLHDGRVIAASAGQDHTVGLWDLATGHAWGAGALGHESVVTCAAFARFDGRLYLVTGTEGHHVHVWVAVGSGFAPHQKLIGHTDAVSTVAATTVAGRPLILSGAADGTARLWDLGTGQPVGRPYTGHLGEVTAAAFHDGIAVTTSADTTVHVWDPRTGRRVFRPLTGHKASVRAVAIARRHGRPIAVTAGDDRTIQLWDLGTGEAVREPLVGHTDWVRSLAAAEVDGRPVLVSGGDDRSVRVWDLESGEPIGAGFRGHVGWVRGVAACEIDTRIVAVSASDDRTLRVWDLHGVTELDNPFAGHTDVVRGVATARVDGRTVAVTCGDDRSVRLWDLDGRKPLGEPLTEHRDWIQAVATTVVDGRPTAVTAGTEGTVRIWDLERQAHVGRPLRGHVGTAWSVATAEMAGVPVAVTSGEDTTIRIWDLRAGAPTGKVIRGHRQRIRAVTTGVLDGRPVAVSGSDDRTVRVWDLLDGERAGPVMRGHTDWVRALTVTTVDGRPVVVSAGDDATILSWDLRTGSRAGPPMLGHRGEIWSLANLTLHDRPTVVSAGQDRTVRVFDLMTGEMLAQPFAGHSDRIRSMAICELDGRPIVVAAGNDRIVRMWDLLADTAADGSIAAHNAWVRSAALAQVAGRPVVMTGGDDGTIRVWDLAHGATAAPPFIGHTGWVYSVAAGRIEDTPVGVSGSDDRSMRIFDLASGSEMGVLLEEGPRQPRRTPKKPGSKQKARAERAPISRVPPIRAVAVHEFRNGRVVAVGAGDDAVIRAWDLANGLELATARIGHSARILTMALDERTDGQPLLLTGSLDGTARLWCLASPPDTTQTMIGHDGAVQSVAFARFPDRLAVVTAGADRTVRVWDAVGGSPIGPPIVGHTGSVLAVAATWFQGRPIAVTGGADATVRVWDLTTYEAIQDIELNAVVLGLAVRPDGLVVATTSEGVVAIDLRGTRD